MQYAPMLYSDHSCVAMTLFELSNVGYWQRGCYRAYHKSGVTQEGVEAPASKGAEPETLPSYGPIRSHDFGALQRSSSTALTKGPSDHPFRPHFNVPWWVPATLCLMLSSSIIYMAELCFFRSDLQYSLHFIKTDLVRTSRPMYLLGSDYWGLYPWQHCA